MLSTKCIIKVLYLTKKGSWRTSYGLPFFSSWDTPLLFMRLKVSKEYFNRSSSIQPTKLSPYLNLVFKHSTFYVNICKYESTKWAVSFLTNQTYGSSTLRSLLSVLFYQTTWSEFYQKVSIKKTRSISEKIHHTVLFQGCHGQFLVSIKQPGLNIWKKSLLNDQYYLCFKL